MTKIALFATAAWIAAAPLALAANQTTSTIGAQARATVAGRMLVAADQTTSNVGSQGEAAGSSDRRAGAPPAMR